MKLVTTEVYEVLKSKARAAVTLIQMSIVTDVGKGVSHPIGFITWDVQSNVKYNLDNQ